ncbi:amidohydrolase [Alkalispirochaeta odontotermitis]|nr:amidohydrolase [Alkalispirochaeta odontotermitis]CAB1075398.1 predicted metal-dependent hydrolase of the TIM-barrel fold [Olavius algarvensis Delta 1 endosymbiont]
MIIDIHTHIFPAEICRNREQFFPAEPAFKLLYQSSKSKMIGTTGLLRAMDEFGVDTSVICGFPWSRPEIYRMHNDYVMDSVQKYPDRLIGLGCFDPADPQAPAETERCLAGGLSGIGELAFYGSGIDHDALEQLDPIMNICHKHGRPVLIHTNEPVGHYYEGKTPLTLAQIYHLIERFPDNNLILAHWGGGLFFYNLMKKQVKERLKNVYFDTAASPFLYDATIYRIASELIGADKVLLGTDFPLLPPARYFSDMDAAGLTQAQIDQICGFNAKRLFAC